MSGDRPPFGWFPLVAYDRVRAVENLGERKAAMLLLTALSSLASRCYDGRHEGFVATVDEVIAEVGVSRNTYRQARETLERLDVLRVEGREDPHGRTLPPCWHLLPSRGEAADDDRRATAEAARHETSRRDDREPRDGDRVRADGRARAPRGDQESILDAQELTPAVSAPPTGEPRKKKGKKGGASAADVERVFSAWNEEVGGRARKFTPARERRIRARLRTWTADELVRAMAEALAQPFYRGQNDRNTPYEGLETLLRDDEQVERFLVDADRRAAGAPAPGSSSSDGSGSMAAIDRVFGGRDGDAR